MKKNDGGWLLFGVSTMTKRTVGRAVDEGKGWWLGGFWGFHHDKACCWTGNAQRKDD